MKEGQLSVVTSTTQEKPKKSFRDTLAIVIITILIFGVAVLIIAMARMYWGYYDDFNRIMSIRFDKDWDSDTMKTEYGKWFNHEDYNWLSIVDNEMEPMYEDRYPTTTTGVPEILYSDEIEPGYYIKTETSSLNNDKYYIIMTVSIPDQNHPAHREITFDLYHKYNDSIIGGGGWERGKYLYDVILMESNNEDEIFNSSKAISTDYSFMMSMEKSYLYISSIDYDNKDTKIIQGSYVRILGFEDWENWDPNAWDGTKWIGGTDNVENRDDR